MAADDKADPLRKPPETTDERRRAALRKLGKVATYGVPVTLSLMSIRHAAAAS